MTDITMPRLTDGMDEGTIVKWLVDDGLPVRKGDDVMEIETDKATTTYEADAEGVLRIVVPEGRTVAVGEVVARIGVAESDSAQAGAAPPEGARNSVPVGARASRTPSAGAAVASAPIVLPGNGTGIAATPLARRIADRHAVALETISGSGPRGRITRSDVLRAAGIAPEPTPEPPAPSPPPAPAPVPAPTSAPPPVADTLKGDPEIRELTRLQQLIARRMTEAKVTIPHFQVQTDVVMNEAVALRAELKATGELSGPVPSVNDIVVRAAALALRHHRLANASYVDGRYVLHARINVGVAVATDDGLIVPTIFDADVKSLGEIACDARRLAERVRRGEIAASELAGGTFTVSNLGMFGMTAITPVINPPQAAILGVGTLRATLARGVDDGIVDRTLLTLTLSCDHRILNGADGSRLLADIKALVEHPLRMAL